MRNVFLILAILIGGLFSQTHAATLTVPVGGNVQTALNSANCGDVIVLQAGAAYNANLTLNKVCASPIIIQSSRAGELPFGVRVNPAQSPLMARLQSVVPGEPVIKTAPGAGRYTFVGVEITTASASTLVYDLVRFGEGRETQRTLESVPRGFVIDRSYIHGWSTQDVQRGVSLNSADTTIANSYISDIHGVGFDSQAIAGWNGTNNVRIINNYLEGAGENVLFGGADAASDAFIPTTIAIIQNYVFKPLTWKVGHSSFVPLIRNGSPLGPNGIPNHWTVKNSLELKNAKNVTIDGNIFENCWTDGQTGIPILFTVRNQDCTNPFATIQNVIYRNNTVKNAEGGINFLGKDNEAEPTYEDRPGHVKCSDPGESFGSVRASTLSVTNNLFVDVRGPFILLNGFDNILLGRNTHFQRSNTMTLYGEQSFGLVGVDNLTIENPWGIFGDGGVIGKAALDRWAPGYVWTGNVMVRSALFLQNIDAAYPAGNFYPTTINLTSDFRAPDWPGKGVDIDALNAAQTGGSQPVPSPSPSPSPSPTPTPLPSPSPTPTPLPSPSPTPVPSPSPSPTPQPTPTPVPVPSSVRKVAWPNSRDKRNEILVQQWNERYRLKRELIGSFAEFEFVP